MRAEPTSVTRRQLVAAVPALAAAAAVATTPALAAQPAVDRRAWDRAMRAYLRVKAEDDAFSPGYLERWERCRAACERVPHVVVDDGYGGRIATSDARQLLQARREVADLDAGRMHLDPIPSLLDHYSRKRQFVEAADRRDAEVRAIRDVFRMDQEDAKGEELGQRFYEATWALMDMPAPDLAALRWKLDYITEDSSFASYEGDALRQLFEDIARLMPAAG